MLKIAIDAMGGDFGPSPILDGVFSALDEKEFLPYLVGDEKVLKTIIPQNYLSRVKIVHANETFPMSLGATDALKRKECSIYKAVELVRDGECVAVVSAGHSGATMSLATLMLGRIKGISRPAIATMMPSKNSGGTLVLDVGANVDCKAMHLFEFAIMAEIYAQKIMNIPKPRIGLLSNGEEDCKGNEITKETFAMLKELDSFVGNAEGGQIFDGSIDVMVCDGFMGNILLKTSEGVATAISELVKKGIKSSPVALFGALLMRGVFKTIKKNTDYDEYGGAPLLGVKNCVIISHGKSSSKAIKNAVFAALKFSNSDISSAIESRVATLKNGGLQSEKKVKENPEIKKRNLKEKDEVSKA